MKTFADFFLWFALVLLAPVLAMAVYTGHYEAFIYFGFVLGCMSAAFKTLDERGAASGGAGGAETPPKRAKK